MVATYRSDWAICDFAARRLYHTVEITRANSTKFTYGLPHIPAHIQASLLERSDHEASLGVNVPGQWLDKPNMSEDEEDELLYYVYNYRIPARGPRLPNRKIDLLRYTKIIRFKELPTRTFGAYMIGTQFLRRDNTPLFCLQSLSLGAGVLEACRDWTDRRLGLIKHPILRMIDMVDVHHICFDVNALVDEGLSVTETDRTGDSRSHSRSDSGSDSSVASGMESSFLDSGLDSGIDSGSDSEGANPGPQQQPQQQPQQKQPQQLQPQQPQPQQ
jgi:hypothetical protein